LRKLKKLLLKTLSIFLCSKEKSNWISQTGKGFKIAIKTLEAERLNIFSKNSELFARKNTVA